VIEAFRADILTINEHLLEVNALDNGSELLGGFEILVGCVERVQWTLEGPGVLHQRAGCGEIPFPSASQ